MMYHQQEYFLVSRPLIPLRIILRNVEYEKKEWQDIQLKIMPY